MPIYATPGATFTPAPAGLHQGACCDVVDLGVVEVTYPGTPTKRQHKIRVVWQLDAIGDDGKRATVSKRYTLSLHEKSGLRKDLESWRGKAFTPAELAPPGFDIERLLGANAQINVTHTDKAGTTYANVTGIVPLGKGMVKIGVDGYIRVKDREPNGPDDEQAPIEDEDPIPFAWLLPLMVPALGMLSAMLSA